MKVPGLWYRDQDKIRANPDVPLLSDLDGEVPAQAGWDLLPMAKYRAHNWHCLDGSEQPLRGHLHHPGLPLSL